MSIHSPLSWVIFLLILLAVSVVEARRGLGASKNQQNGNEGVRVQATGVAAGKPDAVSIHFSVTTVKSTNEESLSELTKTAKAIKAKLTVADLVNDETFSSNQLSTHPEYKYSNQLKENKLIGYRSSQSYSLLVKESTSLSDASAAAVGMIVQAGGDVTRVDSVIPILTNKDKLAKEARETAVKNAMDKAQDYARLLGTSLGAVVYVNEIHSPESRGGVGGGGMMRKASYAAMEMADDGPPDVNVDLGLKETRVSIEVQWRLGAKEED